MKKVTWKQFTEDSVKSDSSGIFCLNQELKDRIKQSDNSGYYIYTKESAYKKSAYKCGLTTVGCVERIHQQKTAAELENLYIVDWIPSDIPKKDPKSDEKIHKEFHEKGLSQWMVYDDGYSNVREWSIFPDNNPGELWWNKLSGKQTRIELGLTTWQIKSLERIVKSLSEGNKVIMAELAARFGKTNTYLSLFDIVQSKVMVIGSYVLTVSTSFKKECMKYKQFENMEFIELNSPTFEEDFNTLLQSDKQIVVFVSLCGGSVVEKNSEIVSQFEDKIVIVDEADYGAHTDTKSPFVKKIAGDSPLILTTGTNSERARGQHDIDDMFRVTYFDMLMMR